MVILDLIIVAALITLPQSYLLWFSSSDFGRPIASRIWIFAAPGLLVGIRWLIARRREPLPTDRVVLWAYGTVLAVGAANALVRTTHPLNVLSVYGQLAYWTVLGAMFLMAAADRDRRYILDLIRRYYLIVAAVAWAYVALRLVFDERLPHVDLQEQFARAGWPNVWLWDYFVTLAVTPDRLFGFLPPRFTFLFREPRIVAIHLLVGIALQVGHLRSQTTRRGRLGAWVGLIGVLGAFVFSHALFAYLLGAALVGYLAIAAAAGARFWRRFRAWHLAAIAVFLPAILVAAAWLTSARTIGALSHWTGKLPEYVEGYLVQIPGAARLLTPSVLAAFPLGTGLMNIDSPRFMATYGIDTHGGMTIVETFAQHAGLFGLVAFAVIAWRILGAAERAGTLTSDATVRSGCLVVGFLLVASAAFMDMISPGPEAILMIGWLLSVAGRGEGSPVRSADRGL